MTPASVLAFAPNTWRGQWVNRQYLLSRLAKTRAVVYSTGAWFAWQRGAADWRAAPYRGGLALDAGVQVETAPRWILRHAGFQAWDRLALKLHARWLQRQVSPGGSAYLCMLFHPQFEPYLEHLQAGAVAYHAYDLFEATPGWTDAHEASERRLLARADVVTTVSAQIADRLRAKGAKAVHVIPNGVDCALFDAARTLGVAPPDDLACIPMPRLGYVGSLHPQVDYGLIADIAERRPDWHVVLIGDSPAHIEPRAAAALARCRELANVHLLGGRARLEVPAYLLHMSVNLMPYRLANDTWVMAGHPLKLYEYLASGRPVVAAALPTLDDERHLLRIASGVDAWIDAIDQALVSDDPHQADQRLAAARINGWDQRADSLEGLISQVWQARFGSAPAA